MQGRLILTSGRTLEFSHIMLFNALHVNHLQRLMSTAQTKLAGFSSPFGALGSFGFVTTVLAANILVESAVNRLLTAEARSLLDEYEKLLFRIRQSGLLVPVDLINNVEIPMPSVWSATVVNQISEPSEVGAFRVPYVHNGDPYVVIGGADSQVSIVWDKVEQYEVV